MNGGGTLVVTRGAKLRLGDGGYSFAEPPDLLRLATTAQRLDFLKEHLQARCELWAKAQRQFLETYFAWIAATLAREPARGELTALGRGLFAPLDWAFAALRPLPNAFLPVGQTPLPMDFAFWTGAGFAGIELVTGTVRAQRRAELDALRQAGIALAELAPGDLAGADALDAKLPGDLKAFWRGLALPPSPFGPRDLAIEPAG